MGDQKNSSCISADDWIPMMLELMSSGKTVKIRPHGYSMWPLLRSDQDEVILRLPKDKLKRGDICLYRRDNGLHVLHRIHHVDYQKKEYYMVGDNQMSIEGPLQEKQILAVVSDICRNGKIISCNSKVYIFVSRLWLFLRRFRGILTVSWRKFRKVTAGK